MTPVEAENGEVRPTEEQIKKFCAEHCLLIEGVGHCYMDCKYTFEDVLREVSKNENNT